MFSKTYQDDNNNIVTINSTGLYSITATINLTGGQDTYNMAINVGGTDYIFSGLIGPSEDTGSVSHTIFLNVTTSPTTVALYNRDGDTINIARAELNVVKWAN